MYNTLDILAFHESGDSLGVHCKDAAINVEILEGEVEPGDTQEVCSNSHWF